METSPSSQRWAERPTLFEDVFPPVRLEKIQSELVAVCPAPRSNEFFLAGSGESFYLFAFATGPLPPARTFPGPLGTSGFFTRYWTDFSLAFRPLQVFFIVVLPFLSIT